MDADTVLDDGFLAAAVRRFTSDRALMAIGGLFYGEEGHGVLGQFQRNEYVRYVAEIRRRRGRVFVLTGTASMFRPRALRTVAGQRGDSLPGAHGDVYDTAALTEDNELTIALKSLGALMVSPTDCTVVTELMPKLARPLDPAAPLAAGRAREPRRLRLTPQTLRYWAQQLGIGYGVIALSVVPAADRPHGARPGRTGCGSRSGSSSASSSSSTGSSPCGSGGWRARLLAFALVPELLYDMYLDVVYVKGIFDITWAGPPTGNTSPTPTHRQSAGQNHDPCQTIRSTGLLLPESLVHTNWFAILATFVAINTIIYAALALAKVLPKVHSINMLIFNTFYDFTSEQKKKMSEIQICRNSSRALLTTDRGH